MSALEQKRQRLLGKLGQDRPLLAGSLSRVERTDARGRVTVFHLLTFKQEGKTRSVYVPKDLVREVKSWIVNHRRLKQLMSEISTISIDIIRSHVPEKRAAAGKSPKKPSSR